MECAGFETRILEYLEGGLPDEERLAVEDHVARCPACRRFHEEQAALDTMLEDHFLPPVAGPDFRRRVLLRIAPRKPAYWPELLDLFGFSGAALAAGIALEWLVPAVAAWPSRAGMTAAWVAVAASAALGLWLALQEEGHAG